MTPEQQKVFGSKTKMIAFILLLQVSFGFIAIWGIITYSAYFVERVETAAVITRERAGFFDGFKDLPGIMRHAGKRKRSVTRMAAYEVDNQTYKIAIVLPSFVYTDIQKQEFANGIKTTIPVIYNPKNPADCRRKLETGDHVIWIVIMAAAGFMFIASIILLRKFLNSDSRQQGDQSKTVSGGQFYSVKIGK